MAYVYRMYVGEEIKYIGFTTNIDARISNHFAPNDWYGNKVLSTEQVNQVTKIEYTETGTANARVLEAYLIAKNKPEWNKDFVEEDDLTFELVTGDIVWNTHRRPKDDNPDHHIFIWRDGELLYEIPKTLDVYTALCEKLGIEHEMEFGYNHPVFSNGYRLMRMSSKRRIDTGAMAQRPKYSFMGYPEKWVV